MAAQYSSGLSIPGFCLAAADVDGSGTVSIVDALMIAQYGVDQINAFPVDIPGPAVLTAPDGLGGDEFGHAVALSGDGYIAAVGAAGNVDEGTGSLQVYRWLDESWQGERILSGYLQAGDNFGYAVALSGDGNTLVAGAPDYYREDSSTGTIHIFRWDGDNWLETEFTAVDIHNDHKLRTAVAVSSDGNVVVAGAPFDDADGDNAGAVYIFTCDGTTWEQTKLTAGPSSPVSRLGTSVAIADDGHAIVAGAPLNNINGINNGTVYVFESDGTLWTAAEILHTESVQTGLGFSVAINATGTVVAAGAPYDDETGEDSGALFVYKKEGSEWIQEKLVNSNGYAYAYQEYAISINDAGNIIIASAPGISQSGSAPGAITVYKWNISTWLKPVITP